MNKRSAKESKGKIINAAIKVFSEYGYKGTSMRMIARAASISVGGLYLYFSNKEDLYLTLIKESYDELTRKVTNARNEAASSSEALNKFISHYTKTARKNRELILIQGREHKFAFGMDIKRKFFMDQKNIIEGIIQQGIASGEFRKCNVAETSKIIFCVLRGFILSLIVEPDSLFSPEECSNLILKGLLREKLK